MLVGGARARPSRPTHNHLLLLLLLILILVVTGLGPGDIRKGHGVWPTAGRIALVFATGTDHFATGGLLLLLLHVICIASLKALVFGGGAVCVCGG